MPVFVEPNGWLSDALRSEVRLMKAAVLYADTVEMTHFNVSRRRWHMSDGDPGFACDMFASHVPSGPLRIGDPVWEGEMAEASDALRLAVEAEVLWTPYDSDPRKPSPPPDSSLVMPLLTAESVRHEQWSEGVPSDHARLRSGSLESALAISLIGQIEAFPDASMDVLLDVRGRIQGARVHFRAALLEAARTLSDAARGGVDLEAALAEIRGTTIDPALAILRDALTALGARQTLRRLARDKFSLTSAGATIAMATGLDGPIEIKGLLSGAIGAPLMAAAASEREFRHELRTGLQQRPFWYLLEANEQLKVRAPRPRRQPG
jgi:hypothetical protein